MKHAILLLLAVLVSGATGQIPMHLKDGRILPAKQLRRDKDTIIATLEIPAKEPGGKPTAGDFGFPLKDIFKLDFPKPGVLDTAPDLVADGRIDDALKQIDPVLKYYAGFRDAPGSWWLELVPLQVSALLAARRDAEAFEIAESFRQLAQDPEGQKFSKAFTALGLTRKGRHEAALPLYEEVAAATERADLLAFIAAGKGESLVAIADALAEKGEAKAAAARYEEAMLSFLRVPALYRTQRMFVPASLLGSARGYLGMSDFDRARVALKELTEQFPASPEAKAAPDLAARIEKTAALRGVTATAK